MKRTLLILLIAACAGSFTGCYQQNSDEYSPQSASILISNLCPDSPPLDIYVNNSLGIQALSYSYYQPYTPISLGTNNIIATITNTVNPIVNSNVTLSPNGYYSYFIIDSLNAITSATVQDILTIPGGDSAKIRILDFAPNAGTVDIANTNGGSIIDSARYFNDQVTNTSYASFVSVPAGTYSFDIRKSGTSTVLLSGGSYAPFTLVPGAIYTLVISGFVGSTGTQAFSISAINNN